MAHKTYPGSKPNSGEGEQTFRLLFESHPIPMFVYDLKSLAILMVNNALVEKYGYSKEEFQAMTLKDILPVQDAARLFNDVNKKQPDSLYSGEWHHQCKNGCVIDVDITSHILEFDGHPAALVLAQDISARKTIEEMLLKRAQELATVADVSTAVSFNLDQGQLLQSVADLSKERFNLYHVHVYLLNEAGDALLLAAGAGEVGRQMVLQGRQIFLHQTHSLVARAARARKGVIVNDIRQELDFFPHPLLPETRAELAVPIIVSDRLIGVLEVQANYINRFTEEDVRIMTTLAAQIAVAVQNARFFGEHRQAEDELRRAKESLEVVNMELRYAFEHEQYMARTDALTGINNRHNLFELAEHEFEVSKRYQQPLSIILFDIDYFKRINDTYGHAVGDKMLERVVQVTRTQLRDVDIIGRYGGEEFVIILPVTTAQKAYLLAQRILENVAAIRLHTDHGPAAVTLSIGIAEIIHTPQDESVDNLIHRADEAMYAAKRAGRNRTVIFGPDGMGEI
jgi:diguanylate cyclase (GGDEF)-like protein/PAS domain S-box-containing protein